MTANVVRVTLTGVITHALDPSYASGMFHTVEGLAMMGFGLAMLSVVQLGRRPRGRTRPGQAFSVSNPTPTAA